MLDVSGTEGIRQYSVHLFETPKILHNRVHADRTPNALLMHSYALCA